MLFGDRGYLLVDDGNRAPLQVGSVACVTGVVKRRDGVSRQAAVARGLGFPNVSHGLNPFYVLRQCTVLVECQRLVPHE